MPYEKALGIHPKTNRVAWVEYIVPQGASWFRGYIGLAKDNKNSTCRGHFTFNALLNDVSFRTEDIAGDWKFAPKIIDIPVTADQILRFEVTDGADTNNCDHATIGSPYFE